MEFKCDFYSLYEILNHDLGSLFSAITYYRKAVQLVPDIEFRLADFQQVKKKRRGKIASRNLLFHVTGIGISTK